MEDLCTWDFRSITGFSIQTYDAVVDAAVIGVGHVVEPPGDAGSFADEHQTCDQYFHLIPHSLQDNPSVARPLV